MENRRTPREESGTRIDKAIGERRASIGERPSVITDRSSRTNETIVGRRDARTPESDRDTGTREARTKIESSRDQKQIDLRGTDERGTRSGERGMRNDSLIRSPDTDRSRTKKVVPETSIPGARGGETTLDRLRRADGTRIHRYTTVTPSYVSYYDRPSLISSTYHYDYAYRDFNGLLCTRLVWPTYYVPVYYDCGSWFGFRYVYPYYHRKYIFISLGGYWPFDYCYMRYYWYGCHPYYWYGYYPVAQEVQGATYNYYTYNYYDGAESAQSQVTNPALLEQPPKPNQTTLADVYFEEGVKAFEAGEYDTAAAKFTKAMELAPEDMILPFARSQALLAGGQYSQAAAILREALAKVSPDKEGVFYPRGLYKNEDTLLDQIELLAKEAEVFNFDADLQLMLGYQLLGIGQTDKAIEHLMHAGKDLVNADAAKVLLKLAEKIKTTNAQPDSKEKGKLTDPNLAPLTPGSAPAPVPAPVPAPLGQSPVPVTKNDAGASRPQADILQGSALGLKKTMFLAGLCALVTGVGVRRFAHR